MRPRHPIPVEFARAVAAAFGAALLPAIVLCAPTLHIAEPFRDWYHYAASCAKMSLILAGILAPLILVVGSAIATTCKFGGDRARAAISGLLVAWWFVPILAIWAGLALAATGNIPGLFWTQTPLPPSSWQSTLDFLGMPAFGIALCVVAALVMLAVSCKRLEEFLRATPKACQSCGYPSAGLPTPTCPECGKQLR